MRGGAAPVATGGSMTFAYAGVAGTTAIGVSAEAASALGLLGAISIIASMIGKSGGYKIYHHYPNDHNPPHVHIKGDDIIGKETRVDINGNPLKGDPPLTRGAKRAFDKLINEIFKALAPWL